VLVHRMAQHFRQCCMKWLVHLHDMLLALWLLLQDCHQLWTLWTRLTSCTGSRRCRMKAPCVTCCGVTLMTAWAGALAHGGQATHTGRLVTPLQQSVGSPWGLADGYSLPQQTRRSAACRGRQNMTCLCQPAGMGVCSLHVLAGCCLFAGHQ
jgi:hypothetical protein